MKSIEYENGILSFLLFTDTFPFSPLSKVQSPKVLFLLFLECLLQKSDITGMPCQDDPLIQKSDIIDRLTGMTLGKRHITDAGHRTTF